MTPNLKEPGKHLIPLPSRSLLLSFVITAFALGGGCATSKQAQLERAAKDWCATIRASQVMPVYPLTEDVQPGDIFLVQVPIDKQQKIFDQKGYLPLDNHLARLNPAGYAQFYRHSFLASNANITLPAAWVRPNGGLSNSWATAPNAAFPSYSFSVQHGAGINLAFPVEGVPVGLSLLGTDAADGTVIIKSAHTLGIDTVSLYHELQGWAETNADFLNNFGSVAGTNYVRVVSRIYTVGYVDVSLRDSSSRSGGVDVGVAKPVNLLAPQLMQAGTRADTGTVQSNFVQGNNLIQQIMTNALAAKDAAGNLLPGGSLRLTAASGRTVSLQETFEPPLTIGYLGFDCSIMGGGALGPPIPTFAVLNPNFNLRPIAKASARTLLDVAIYKIIREQSATDPSAKRVVNQLDALETLVPADFTSYEADDFSETNFILVSVQKDASVLHNPKVGGFQLLVAYRQMLDGSIGNLKQALALPRFTLLRDRSQPPGETVTKNSAAYQTLSAQSDYYQKLRKLIAADLEYQRAMAAAYAYEKQKL